MQEIYQEKPIEERTRREILASIILPEAEYEKLQSDGKLKVVLGNASYTFKAGDSVTIKHGSFTGIARIEKIEGSCIYLTKF